MNQFRYSLNRNSPAMGKIIRAVERYGYYYQYGRKYKLKSARKEGVEIHLTVEQI